MHAAAKKLTAEQAYDKGAALFYEHKYVEAIAELRRAEELFRRIDARGHPIASTLKNGISGLANTLFLLGLCHRRIGDDSSAISYLEKSLINERFEHRLSFRSFRKDIYDNLSACYEKEIAAIGPHTLQTILQEDPDVDHAFRFPFSLAPNAIPIARLYEIMPKRYQHFRFFYERARKKDSMLRRRSDRTDSTSMRKISISIWGILAIIWAIYGIVVFRALVHQK